MLRDVRPSSSSSSSLPLVVLAVWAMAIAVAIVVVMLLAVLDFDGLGEAHARLRNMWRPDGRVAHAIPPPPPHLASSSSILIIRLIGIWRPDVCVCVRVANAAFPLPIALIRPLHVCRSIRFNLLPAFLEKALNTSKNAAKSKGEIGCLNDAITQRVWQGHARADVIETLERAQPECSKYVGAIVDLAQEFCEANCKDLDLQSLHQFSLRYGQGIKLGEEYSHSTY